MVEFDSTSSFACFTERVGFQLDALTKALGILREFSAATDGAVKDAFLGAEVWVALDECEEAVAVLRALHEAASPDKGPPAPTTPSAG